MPIAQSSTTTTSSSSTKNKLANKENVNRTASADQQENQDGQNQQQEKQGGNKTPPEQPEFIKQALIIIEKKVRNLDKRRIKLEEYKADQKKGQKLNEDQLLAVSKYDEVLRSLELSRELEKQFIGLANDAMKQQKKQAKKEQLEREELVKEKLKEVQKLISVLNKFGHEEIRNDFLNEKNGAIKISQLELNILDEFDKLIEPSELDSKLEALSGEVADHFICAIEGKNKPITQINQALSGEQPVNVTYSDLKKLFEKLMTCTSYWNQPKVSEQPIEQPIEPEPVEQLQQQQQQQEVIEPVQQSQPQPEEDINRHQVQHLESQNIYHQQNTSDDYVIVSSNDYNNDQQKQQLIQQQQSPLNQQQPQQQTKTFFTTLNRADLSTQFLNRGESNEDGFNFLQDSEIQQQQQLQHQPKNNQEFNQNDNQQHKDYRQQQQHRGGHNGGNRNYPNKPRYSDERRNTGGAMPSRHGGPNNTNSPYNNNNRNVNGGGQGGGYRGGNQGGNRPDNRGPGGGGNYYRGQGGNNAGRDNRPAGNGPRGGYRQNMDNNQQPIVQE